MRSRVFAILALAGVLTACTDDVSGPGGSGGDFTISVGGGTHPSYSWSAGPAFTIDVVRTSNPSVVVWRVADPSTMNIQSPVTHGTKPSNALETTSSERTLSVGVEYRVTVTLADGRQAYREFTP
ncbi:MAG: hypothetical protein PVH00_01670 [Gemmatimonadota bacterium]|jgi:hypothetical protein